MEPRPESLFLVSELWGDLLEEPTMYISGQLPTPEYEVEYSGSFRIKIWGRERFFNLSDEGLRKIRHEIVASVMSHDTDEKLSSIGVTGPLSIMTPDFILNDSKAVLEVGTCAGTDDSYLISMYKDKNKKYKELVEAKGFDFSAVIVSRSKVYTNLKLSQSSVDALVLRFRIGYALEAKISDMVGENIFSEDWSELENHCKSVLTNISNTAETSEKFDISTILSMSQQPSKLESARVGSILKHNLNLSSKPSNETPKDLKDYIQKFDVDSKTTNKRITNIPMIINDMKQSDDVFLDCESSNMPSWLKSVWIQAREINAQKNTEELTRAINEAMGRIEFTKHRLQKESAFSVDLCESDRVEAAKSGLWAKSLKEHSEVIEKDRVSHLSFHPTQTDTHDVDEFMRKDMLTSFQDSIAVPKEIWKMISRAKNVSGADSVSSKVLESITTSKLSWFGQMISELFTEICYSYKYWIKRSDFYHKVHKGIHLLIRCTGDHTFVSFAFPKAGSEVIDTGRIGPVIYESEKFFFTKFSSYNEPTVEHFVKAGPYLTSIYCHLLSHFEIPINKVQTYDDDLIKTLNGILLLYLNNKTDSEELITNQRYLTMGILEEIDPNPYRFVDRLPDVYRSRLTCYLFKQTMFHMNYYASSKIIKSKTGIEEDESLEHDGLLSIFTNRPISLKQKVNEFYFGYVISKERGRGSDRNFKIMKKIVAEEFRFRDTVKTTFEDSLNPSIHVSNPIVIKVFMSIFRKHLKSIYGKDWEYVLTRAIYHNFAKKSFYEIATMKVASRTYQDKITVPTMASNETTYEIRKTLEKANPNEVKRRPRVMEAIKLLVDEYTNKGNPEPIHPIDLLPYCLEKIRNKSYFDSDIFPKPQHGGDREIHVLEITMRIVQLFMETISRTVCEHIDSDSLTHPKSKDTFVKNHYRQSNEHLKSHFVTLGKSADASKWCQRHHSSKFAAVLVGCLPHEFWAFAMSVMHLWQFKRISFPIQFAANFLSNVKVKSNKVYERMRSEFFAGSGIFSEPCNNKMTIQSGMMQGILHYTSSLVHAVVQVVMKIVQEQYLKSKKIDTVITIIQGSDDSAELISLSGKKTVDLVRIGTTMLHWKEHMSKYFSIYTSRAKSSIGTIDLIEYNSEWSIRSSIIKPTFRWVSSCLETGIVEKFVDRYQNMQSTLTTVLEGGGKLLEVAMIQMCQAWMHYMLIGLHTSVLSELATYFMLGVKDPSLGFFPLDSDYTAGITGFNYSLYELYSKTNYGDGLGRTSMKDVEIDFFEDDTKDPSIGKDLRKVRIKFGDHKIFENILRDMSIPELEKIIQHVEDDPSLLYFPSHDWSTSKFRIFLKMFEPGVKESLSRHSATARMMSASAYMLSRPCFSHPDSKKKCSLLYLLALEFHRPQKGKLDPHLVFLHEPEYRQLSAYIEDLSTNSYLRQQNIKTRSKQRVVVFDVEDDGPTLIDMCKNKWFGKGRIPYSSRQFEAKWKELKTTYKFLEDDRVRTKNNLKMSDIQLKNFLEAQSEKVRAITLMDTAAKASSLHNSITRIFWSNTKIVQAKTEDDDDTSYGIRSRIFSLLTSFLPYAELQKEITNQLVSSKLLSQTKVPAKVSKLKCVRDLMVTGNKSSVAERVIREKLGSIGFFTIRQSGWGLNRSGYGEWKGRVLDSSVVIKMMGNFCTLIQISNLKRVKELGIMLSQLINGFSLEGPSDPTQSEHWISKTGRISYGRGAKKSIPIEVIPELRVDFIDQIVNYRWNWEVNYNRIKIVAVADSGLKEKITILSETFNSSDWDPFHGIEGNSDIALWSRGERASLDMLRNEFSEYMGKSRSELLRCIKNSHKITTINGWSISKVVELLKYFYPRTSNLELQDSESTDVSDFGDEEMNDLISYMMSNEADITNDVDLEYDDNDEDIEMFQMEDIDLVDLEAQLSLLLQQSDPTLSNRIDKSKMPISNQFFYNLNVLSITTYNMGISELWTKFSQNELMLTHDILGIILTFMTKRICIKTVNDDEKDALALEQESISIITSIKSEMEVDDLNEEELEWAIKDLESKIPNAPIRLQPKMKSSLKRFKVALKLIKVPINDNYDLDSIDSQDVLYTLSQKNHSKEFSTNPKIAVAQIRQYIDSKMDDLLSKAELTPHEHSIYRESIYKNYCTPMLIDALALTFEMKISLKNYTSGDYEEFFEFVT